jgi:hypothetical protein
VTRANLKLALEPVLWFRHARSEMTGPGAARRSLRASVGWFVYVLPSGAGGRDESAGCRARRSLHSRAGHSIGAQLTSFNNVSR